MPQTLRRPGDPPSVGPCCLVPLTQHRGILNTHRAAGMREYADEHDRFTVVQLPSYAPDVNPAEGIWSLSRRGPLANVAFTFGFPHASQVAKTVRHRTSARTGKRTRETRYVITDLTSRRASPREGHPHAVDHREPAPLRTRHRLPQGHLQDPHRTRTGEHGHSPQLRDQPAPHAGHTNIAAGLRDLALHPFERPLAPPGLSRPAQTQDHKTWRPDKIRTPPRDETFSIASYVTATRSQSNAAISTDPTRITRPIESSLFIDEETIWPYRSECDWPNELSISLANAVEQER
jgi:hypothetical protein